MRAQDKPVQEAKADCPMCNPCNPELDEDGRAYTCYVCCDTGRVPKSLADAYWQERQDAVQYKKLRPVVEGKHIGWAGNEYDSWETVLPLLPAAVLAKSRRNEPARISDGEDDLPF